MMMMIYLFIYTSHMMIMKIYRIYGGKKSFICLMVKFCLCMFGGDQIIIFFLYTGKFFLSILNFFFSFLYEQKEDNGYQ